MDIIGNSTLRDVWDDLSARHGKKTALIFEESAGQVSSYSYAELNRQINKAANLFASLGIGKGQNVGVQLCNSPEIFICLFGLAKLGAVCVPINAHFLHDEVLYVLRKCDIHTVVTGGDFRSIYTEIHDRQEARLDNLLLIKTEGVLQDHEQNFTALLAQQSAELNCTTPLCNTDPVEILFTSGTTSLPKGVVITHHNLVFSGYYTAWQAVLVPDDIYMTVLPAYHIDCQCTAAMPTFTVGATFVLLEKYSARKFWNQVLHYRCTVTECIPLMIRTLLLQPCNPQEREHCLREVFFYMNLGDDEKDAFLSRFNVRLLTSYGMTETIVGLIGDRPGDRRKWPSIGRLGFTYEARVVNCAGNDAAPEEPGELWIKGIPGKTIFKEYYNDPEATARTLMPDGWFRTGDITYVDNDGYFYFVDRDVNMIKRAGENISCAEIENVLCCHPDIVEAAVIGIPDSIRGEAVKAFVVCRNNKCLIIEELCVYCSERLASFKVPSCFEICTALPHTSTGKVKKHVLRKTDGGKPLPPAN